MGNVSTSRSTECPCLQGLVVNHTRAAGKQSRDWWVMRVGETVAVGKDLAAEG